MSKQEKIVEEVPITNTTNNGNGLVEPKLPIKKDNIFKRYKQMMLTRKSSEIK